MLPVSVIIPVKDEPNINKIVQQLHIVLSDVEHEIIVVYGDKSRSPPVVSNAVVFKIYGDSLERAILSGFSVAKHENMVVMDGDGSHPPQIVPGLLSKLEHSDLVIASRYLKGGSAGHMSPYRRIVAKTFKKTANVLGVRVSDPMSGFFALKKKTLEGMQFKPIKWKVLFEILSKKGHELKVEEVPYTYERRAIGRSKTSSRIALTIIKDMLLTSKKMKTIPQVALTILLLIVIIYLLDFSSLRATLLEIKLRYLLLSIVAYIVMTVTLAYRLFFVLRKIGVKISFKDVFWSHTFGMLIANVNPAGKVGYLSSIPLLSRYGKFEQKDALAIVLGIQSIELLVKAILAALSITFFMHFSGVEIISHGESLLPAIIGTASIVLLGVIGISILWFKPYWLEDVPVVSNIAGYWNTIPILKSLFWQITLISLVCWLFRGVEWYSIGLSIGSSLPFITYLVMHPLLTAVRFIPLTPSSLGIFEMTVIWGMGSLGFTPEMGFMFALIDRFDNIVDIFSIKEIWRKS